MSLGHLCVLKCLKTCTFWFSDPDKASRAAGCTNTKDSSTALTPMLTTLLLVAVIATLMGRLVALDPTLQGLGFLLAALFAIAIALGGIAVNGEFRHASCASFCTRCLLLAYISHRLKASVMHKLGAVSCVHRGALGVLGRHCTLLWQSVDGAAAVSNCDDQSQERYSVSGRMCKCSKII